jgi:hypothetical protein
MKPSYGTSLIIGAVAGLFIALAMFLFVASLGAVSSLQPAIETDSVEPVFSMPASTLWWMTIIVGGVSGALLGGVTRAIAAVLDPDASAAPMWLIASLGATVGAVIGVVVFPLGVTILGTISEGIATVTVTQMIVLLTVAGALGGAIVVWQSYLLSRPPIHVEDTELLAA